MKKTIRIRFERGGTFTAVLDEERAPKNVATLLSRLPLEIEACHGMLSGEMFFAKVDGLPVVRENPRVMGVPQGCVAFEEVPVGTVGFPPGILIAYGEKVRFATPYTPDGEPIWMVGQIQGNLDQLYQVGRRLHERGVEKMVIERGE